MRPVFFLLGFVALASITGGRAAAQNYPWCADYGGHMGGSSNCGFTSFQQCMAALSGNGGFCDRNTQYVPPPGPRPAPHYRRWHHSYYPQP